MKKRRKFRCPNCKSLGGRVIIWGMPRDKDALAGYYIGGCSMEFVAGTEKLLNRGCLDCDHKWGNGLGKSRV